MEYITFQKVNEASNRSSFLPCNRAQSYRGWPNQLWQLETLSRP